MEKFNLASLNGGKSPFVVSSDRLLKVENKKLLKTPQQRIKDKYLLESLLGPNNPQAGKTLEKKNPFDVTSSKLL